MSNNYNQGENPNPVNSNVDAGANQEQSNYQQYDNHQNYNSTMRKSIYDLSSKDQLALGRWNWGAFMFSVWWGIGHGVYKTLMILIPFFGLVWWFICGAKGNEWLWESGKFSSPQELVRFQESWNKAGKICFFVSIGLVALYFILATILGAMVAAILGGGISTVYY